MQKLFKIMFNVFSLIPLIQCHNPLAKYSASSRNIVPEMLTFSS